MSARKKKSLSNLQQTYDSIIGAVWNQRLTFMPLITSAHSDLLVKTKPHLNDGDVPNRPSLVQNLHQIASLAESFSEQRPRSDNSWNHLADNLDQEGQATFSGQLF